MKPSGSEEHRENNISKGTVKELIKSKREGGGKNGEVPWRATCKKERVDPLVCHGENFY